MGVNTNITPRVFFGEFGEGEFAIADGNNAALEICAVSDITSGTITPLYTGYFDILNFVWFQGSLGLSSSTAAASIAENSFFNN